MHPIIVSQLYGTDSRLKPGKYPCESKVGYLGESRSFRTVIAADKRFLCTVYFTAGLFILYLLMQTFKSKKCGYDKIVIPL